VRRPVVRFLSARPGIGLALGLLPGVACLLVFVAGPLLALLVATFWTSSIDGMIAVWNLDNYRRLFSDPIFTRLLFKSLRIALVVTLAILVLGYPLAYVIARKATRFKALLLLLVFIPYWISYVIRSYAWYPILGREGAINYALTGLRLSDRPLDLFLFNEFSVHLGLVSVFLPFGVVPIYLSLERIPQAYLEAAADLGARPVRSFIHVLLPLSLPGLLGGGLMVFILTIGAYVTPQLLGGPGGIMLGNIIADQFGATFNWTWGGTLSLAMMLVTLGVIWLVSRQVQISQIFVGKAS
jgi:spermidine/putrescine transport system permease protein